MTASISAGRLVRRAWPALFLIVIAVATTLAILPARARAQGSGVTSSTPRDDDAGRVSRNDAQEPRVDAQESFLAWMARASGPIGLVIALMSFYLIALVAWMAMNYRLTVAIPERLTSELAELLDQSRFPDAYNRLITDPSPFARVLAAGVRKLPLGQAQARRALELANEDMVMEMEHRTTYLATVGTLGPMIGLVGTVYGMIMSFRVIATAGATPQASQLAAGISTALFATLEGIAISIPAIYFHSWFRNRIARLSLQIETMAEQWLERFAPGVRQQAPAQGPVAPPHPFAVSAALAAAQAAGTPRSALPPVEPSDG